MMKNYAAFIGIDWADKTHAVCLFTHEKAQPEKASIKHTPEVLHQWARKLQKRFEHQPIAIALEQSKGALIHFLMQFDCFDIYPINPLTSAQFRKAFQPSGAKDDPSDAYWLGILLMQHRDKLKHWQPEDCSTRKLALLCEARRKMVNMRTRFVLMLKALLKGYFPQAIELLGDDLSTKMAYDFLLKWPSLKHLRGAEEKTIRSFYYTHHSRSEKAIQKRLELIVQTEDLTKDEAVIQTSIIQAELICKQLRTLHRTLGKYDQEIQQLFRAHEDAFIYESLPGAGKQLAPRLLSAMGSSRDKWESAADIQKFSGVAPVTVRSGNSQWIHFRWSAPRFIRQSFHEFARCSMGQSLWAKAYYEMLRQKGKGRQAAIRSLAFKWIRIIFKCWKERKEYDEMTYLKALQKTGSPVIKMMAEGCS